MSDPIICRTVEEFRAKAAEAAGLSLSFRDPSPGDAFYAGIYDAGEAIRPVIFQPADPDRDAFEAWFMSEPGAHKDSLMRFRGGEYGTKAVEREWAVFRAGLAAARARQRDGGAS